MIEQKDLPEIITNGNIELTIVEYNDHTISYTVKVDGVKKDKINLQGSYAILLDTKAQEEDYLYYYNEGAAHKMERQMQDQADIGRAIAKHEMLLRKRALIVIDDFSHVIPGANKKEEKKEKVEIPIKRYSNEEFLSKLGDM